MHQKQIPRENRERANHSSLHKKFWRKIGKFSFGAFFHFLAKRKGAGRSESSESRAISRKMDPDSVLSEIKAIQADIKLSHGPDSPEVGSRIRPVSKIITKSQFIHKLCIDRRGFHGSRRICCCCCF